MRITFLFPLPNFSGGCRVVAIYAEGLAKKGHEVNILATLPRKRSLLSNVKRLFKFKKWLKKEADDSILKNSHFCNMKGVDVNFLPSRLSKVTKILPVSDVIIATWWETAEWLNQVTLGKEKIYYFIQHHEVHSHLPIERVKATYRLPFKKITIAQWLVDVMENNYNDKNVSLIPNGVDVTIFNAQARDKQMTPTFSIMYAREDFKGTDVSFAAFEYAKKKYPQIKLLVFGAKNIDKNIPLPEGAVFYLAPKQEKIKEIYSYSDGYIFSSRSEGFGLPVLEAMACRCPVIATKAGCAPDFIRHGVNGELNEVDDFEAQGESIIKFIEMNNSDWRNMSEAAHKSVVNNTWEKSISEFENILSE